MRTQRSLLRPDMFAIVDVPLLASTHSNIGFTAFNDANRRQTTLLGSHVRRKTGFADARLRGASARRRNLSGIRRAPRRSVRAGGGRRGRLSRHRSRRRRHPLHVPGSWTRTAQASIGERIAGDSTKLLAFNRIAIDSHLRSRRRRRSRALLRRRRPMADAPPVQTTGDWCAARDARWLDVPITSARFGTNG